MYPDTPSAQTTPVSIGMPLLAACCVLIATPAAAQRYEITDLGTLGGRYTWGLAINENGEVVGESELTDDETTHAFLWRDGTMIHLGTMGGRESRANDINDLGQVVGESDVPDETGNEVEHAFLWQDGEFRDLSMPLEYRSSGVAINNSGVVVNWIVSEYLDGGDGYAWGGWGLWQDGELILTEAPSYPRWNALPVDINELGHVIGRLSPDSYFLWDGDVTIVLDELPEFENARAINNAGEMVGSGVWPTDEPPYDIAGEHLYSGPRHTAAPPPGPYHAALGREDELIDLRTLGGQGSGARGINDTGQVAGNSGRQIGETKARLWLDDLLVDLNDSLPDGCNVVLYDWAEDMNDAGQILVNGNDGDDTRAYVLTPVDEAEDDETTASAARHTNRSPLAAATPANRLLGAAPVGVMLLTLTLFDRRAGRGCRRWGKTLYILGALTTVASLAWWNSACLGRDSTGRSQTTDEAGDASGDENSTQADNTGQPDVGVHTVEIVNCPEEGPDLGIDPSDLGIDPLPDEDPLGDPDWVSCLNVSGGHLPDDHAEPSEPVVLDTQPHVALASPSPESLATGDFDNNGSLDLVVANRDAQSLSVFLNNGDGTFGDVLSYGIPGHAFWVAVGDVNNDDQRDLVAAVLTRAVVIMLGHGDGTFTEHGAFRALGYPSYVTLADLDNDADLDVVAALGLREGNALSVMLNDGDGTLALADKYDAYWVPDTVAVGDFDGDGNADLAATNARDLCRGVLLGDGQGNFTPGLLNDVGEVARVVAAADLDNDGDVDLLNSQGGDGGGGVGVLLNNGDGTFADQETTMVSHGPWSFALDDLDGDGSVDLAFPLRDEHRVSILLNNGDGTFGSEMTFATMVGPTATALGDFDGDGILDIAVASPYSDSIAVYLNPLSLMPE